MKRVFLVHRDTRTRFELLKFDRDKREMTLKGAYSTWVEPYDAERLRALGYDMVVEQGSPEAPTSNAA